MTVLVQSSTATTILTVGFVSAGLISFFSRLVLSLAPILEVQVQGGLFPF